MRAILIHPGLLLRGKIGTANGPALLRLLLTLILFGSVYGVTMGAFGGRWLQALYAGIKVPMLLVVTFLLALPSFFVINSLRGLRNDFGRVVQALVATQAGLTIVLASLAPVTAFCYISGVSYDAALNLNIATFSIASFAGQFWLRRAYRPLIARDARHRLMLWSWLFIYAFVGIQMGWVLRPFIGSPSTKTQFLRHDAWGNAYVEVLGRLIR